MNRRPLFALSLIVLACALWLAEMPGLVGVLTYLLPAPLLLIPVGLLRGLLPLVRCASGAVIAVIILLSLQWAPPFRSVDAQPARLQGTVVDARSTRSGGWYIVAGELDLRSAPACACTVIVSFPGEEPLPPSGSTVVAIGRAAPPRLDEGWSELEVEWCRSRAATFLMKADQFHLLGPPSTLHAGIEQLRHTVSRQLRTRLPAPTAATMQAMILGDRTALDADLRTASIHTGTAHLFAVSGLHVGAVLGLVLLLTGGSVRRWYHWAMAMGAVGVFVAVTGGEPPAIRALIMACGAGLARIRERRVDGLNLLGASILIELYCWPTLILRPSFLLSTAVTAGLVWLVPPLVHRLRRLSTTSLWQTVVPVVSVHLAAAASSAIPGAILFGSVSVIAPVVNLLVVPLMVLALLSTVVSLLAGLVVPSIGEFLAWTPSTLVTVAEAVISAAADAQPTISDASVPLVAVLFTAAILWQLKATTMRGLATRLILGTAGLFLVVTLPEPPSDGVLCRPVGNRVQVRVAAPEGVTQFDLGIRYGRPFVRSYDDRHSSHSGP